MPMSVRTNARWLFSIVVAAAVLVVPHPAAAFWLLGFSTADTLPAGDLAAIAGTGGQYTSVGHPAKDSFTAFLPHAGLRVGLADGWDIGYRLTQVALPFSSVGPSLGSEIDLKYRLLPAGSEWQAAIVLGAAYSYLAINSTSRSAWSPGADLIVSHPITPRFTAISELRYVYTEIPTGPGGGSANHLSAIGIDLGVRIGISQTVSLIPEVGVFDFTGRLANRSANGVAGQYGAVLAFRF